MSYLTYPTPTHEEFRAFQSEAPRYRHLVVKYLAGCGVDIGSQGAAIVPWAISFDQPIAEFLRYSSGNLPFGPVHLRGFAHQLPFESGSLDFVFSSHVIEDFEDWNPILDEWIRCLKIGGRLVLLYPDKELWTEALRNGQPPNDAHRHESYPGEMTTYLEPRGMEVLEDRLTAVTPEDYSILCVAIKTT